MEVKMRRLAVALIGIMLGMWNAAFAQPCNGSTYVNPALGSSTCVEVCPGSVLQIHVYGPLGPHQTPVFGAMMTCNPWPETLCDYECPFPPGPIFFQYDATAWTYNSIEGSFDNFIYGTGEGCLCLTFEAILGVSLSSFEAIAGDNRVTLSWTTGSETENSKFEILRDGVKLAEIASQGNTTSGHEYRWVDESALNGTTYSYALSAIDMNGIHEEVATASATPEPETGLVVEYALHANYPNPFNPTTTIRYDLKENGFTTLSVYAITGQLVATLVNDVRGAGTHFESFDALDLPSGMYLYKLEVNGFAFAEKMLLIK